jgi:hypothetical protein
VDDIVGGVVVDFLPAVGRVDVDVAFVVVTMDGLNSIYRVSSVMNESSRRVLVSMFVWYK